jgi:hypothetical protein
MRLSVHLIVSAIGKVRVTKSLPALDADEIAVRLNLDIPSSYFARPHPVLSATLPERSPDADLTAAVVEVTAETVARSLRVSVDAVRDSLSQIVAETNTRSSPQTD